MAEHKFSRKVTQAQGHGFDAIGDSYEGTYTGVKDVQLRDEKGAQRTGSLVMLTPDDGDRFGVWANPVLLDLLTDVQIGSYVRITHTGVGPKKGKRSPVKLFEIEIAE